MPFATLDDVQVYAPDVEEVDGEKVDYLLEQAEDLITSEIADLAARVADNRIPLIRIVRVEAEMVAGVMNNPRARQSESQTVGGLSSSHTVDTKVASGLLTLTARHRQMLGVASGGAGSIAPVIGWTRDNVPLLPDYRWSIG